MIPFVHEFQSHYGYGGSDRGRCRIKKGPTAMMSLQNISSNGTVPDNASDETEDMVRVKSQSVWPAASGSGLEIQYSETLIKYAYTQATHDKPGTLNLRPTVWFRNNDLGSSFGFAESAG